MHSASSEVNGTSFMPCSFKSHYFQDSQHLSVISLESSHFQEWKNSGVHPDLIRLNVKSLSGDAALEFVIGDHLHTLGGFSDQYATSPVIRLLDKYNHVSAGGWAAGQQFKPDNPREDPDKPGKLIKYENQYKVPAGAFFPAISWRVGRKIARRHGFLSAYNQRLLQQGSPHIRLLLTTHDQTFWDWWLSLPSSPVLITEGAKKAGCLLSNGYAAISLPGVFSGYRSKDRLGNPIPRELISELEPIAGHPILLAFDSDAKPDTIRKVGLALSRFGALLQAQGCPTRIVRWQPRLGKGCDDLIVNHGAVFFHNACLTAFTLEEFRIHQSLENQLTISASLQGDFHDLSNLSTDNIPKTGIIAIAAPKGTGKTHLINNLAQDANSALLLGHRIVLTRNLCQRLNLDYRGDISKLNGRFVTEAGYTLRLATVVDSLMAIDPASFRGCDLVIDEVCQVLRHLLTSNTCAKDGKRPLLLARFHQLIQVARRVIVADADLNNHTLFYLQQLRGDKQQPFLIRSDLKPEGYPVRWIETSTPEPAIAELLYDLEQGLKIFVATDSKAGSKRLARLVESIEQMQLKVLLINSETSGAEVERQFITNPNQSLEEWDCVIASPSMATGVSIEKEHFHKVYGLFWGSSALDGDMTQALSRVRQPIPRVVWCAELGNNFSKVGRDPNPIQLKTILQHKTDANALMVRQSLAEISLPDVNCDWVGDPHLNLWARLEAERNRSMWNLRTALKIRLMYEGNRIEPWKPIQHENPLLCPDYGRIKERYQVVRSEIKQQEALAISSARNLTAIEAKALEQLESYSPEDLVALQKFHLCEFYVLLPEQITPEFVLADNGGRRRAGILNLENLVLDLVALQADVRSIQRQAQWGYGFTAWDLSTATLQRRIRVELGLEHFLDPELVWSNESLVEFRARTLKLAPQIKAGLNISIQEEMTSNQILGQLLDQLAIQTTQVERKQVDCVRTRRYAIQSINWVEVQGILSRRAQRREQLNESWPPSPTNYLKGGGWPVQHPVEVELEQNALHQAPEPVQPLIHVGDSVLTFNGMAQVLAIDPGDGSIQVQGETIVGWLFPEQLILEPDP